jgi:glyoxylase-like metal-dependent hydrolase (beta-lactamase superfamily II)
MTLHWGNVDVILEHHPGPMPGSLWVSIPDSKVIFVGDAVLVNQPPFLAYADLESWITSLEQLVRLYKDYFIVSGRGGQVTIKEVRAQIRSLKSVLDGFEKLHRKDSAPEAVESMVNPLLKAYLLDNEMRERYAQRLRYGLIQSYARRYRSTNEMGDAEIATEEQ